MFDLPGSKEKRANERKMTKAPEHQTRRPSWPDQRHSNRTGRERPPHLCVCLWGMGHLNSPGLLPGGRQFAIGIEILTFLLSILLRRSIHYSGSMPWQSLWAGTEGTGGQRWGPGPSGPWQLPTLYLQWSQDSGRQLAACLCSPKDSTKQQVQKSRWQ